MQQLSRHGIDSIVPEIQRRRLLARLGALLCAHQHPAALQEHASHSLHAPQECLHPEQTVVSDVHYWTSNVQEHFRDLFTYLPWRCRVAYASCQALRGCKFAKLRELSELQYRNMVSAMVLWPCKEAL